MIKKTSDSYLFQTADYGKEMFNFYMSAKVIDKKSDEFADVVYDMKRQTQSVLMKVFLSDKIVLLIDPTGKGLSRPFKVTYAKDVKTDKNKKKVFIDCTGLISESNGAYRCTNVGTLRSYIFTAMVYVLYYNAPKTILTNVTLMKAGTEAFVDMMLYVLGYLKVPVTYADNKERMSFVLAEYYQLCIAGREQSDGVAALAQKISQLTDKKACDYLHTIFRDTFDDGNCDIKKFLEKFSEFFIGKSEGPAPQHRAQLTVDAFSQRWMYAFGPSTFMGLELFVPFSAILTDCWIGSFINQQNTIEKIVGKNVTTFSNELLKIGSENA